MKSNRLVVLTIVASIASISIFLFFISSHKNDVNIVNSVSLGGIISSKEKIVGDSGFSIGDIVYNRDESWIKIPLHRKQVEAPNKKQQNEWSDLFVDPVFKNIEKGDEMVCNWRPKYREVGKFGKDVNDKILMICDIGDFDLIELNLTVGDAEPIVMKIRKGDLPVQ